MSIHNMYPRLYHTHHSSYLEDLPFWLELATHQKGPILELGCGTGRVLLALAKAGFAAYGLDKDAGMLAILKDQLNIQPLPNCTIFQADMAAFHLACRFPLILLPCNTLSTLNTPTRLAMLAQVHQHLLPGGWFAASLPNPMLLAQLPSSGEAEIETIFPHPVDSEPVQVSSAWQRSGTRFTLAWHYDHLLPDGRVERFTAQTHHETWPVEYYQEELGAAGLRIENLYGDFDRSPYTAEAPDLVIVATKSPQAS